MTEAGCEWVVVLTQNDAAASRLADPLANAGVRVWRIPVVVSEPVPDLREVDRAFAELVPGDWVAFTSARAAAIVGGRPAWRDWPWGRVTYPRIAVVGPATREAVSESGAPVALCPATAGADELARALIVAHGRSLEGTTVFWPRSAIARPTLRELLVAAHARVIDPIAYTTAPNVPPDIREVALAIQAGRVDAVTFLSPSCAEGLAAALGEATLASLDGRTIVASVGATTTAALIRLGAPPSVEAADRTSGGLAAALLARLAARGRGLP
jgi:uroporphyrinogen-III synthase